MNQKLYSQLEHLAIRGQTANYEKVAKQIGCAHRSKRFYEELGQCSQHSLKNHGFMISTVVLRKNRDDPGPGYFWLARYLGLGSGHGKFSKGRFVQKQLDLISLHYRNKI